MLQNDSINISEQEAGTENVHTLHHAPTPAEIIHWLPKNSTEEQKDSAIQANTKFEPIRYSSEPDTLHLPGGPKGKSFRDVGLPQYYKQSFFSDNPMYHPEIQGGRQGVAGDPIPYTVGGDNVMTVVLIACFAITVLVLAHLSRFIGKQFRRIFYAPGDRDMSITETSGELELQFFMVLQTSLFLSMAYFFYTNSPITGTFVVQQYTIIGIFAAIVIAYFLIKALLYLIVNMTFFGSKINEHWMKSFLFFISMEGVFLFPVVMLLVYFDLSVKTAFIYTIIVIAFFKILTFCKSYVIFFWHRRGGLQIILYFCALEIVPLAALWGFLQVASEYLKVNI